MPTITEISVSKKGRNRERTVTIDGSRGLAITEETFRRFDVAEGKTIATEKLKEMEIFDGVVRAMVEAHRLIDFRMRTRHELLLKLTSRGWSIEVVEDVLRRLEKGGLVDDEHFSRLWIDERLRNRPVGLALLRRELKQKGVNTEIIKIALEEQSSNDEETERAYEALRRQSYRYVRLDRNIAHRRMVAFLARRGFVQTVIYKVVHRVLDEIQESEN